MKPVGTSLLRGTGRRTGASWQHNDQVEAMFVPFREEDAELNVLKPHLQSPEFTLLERQTSQPPARSCAASSTGSSRVGAGGGKLPYLRDRRLSE